MGERNVKVGFVTLSRTTFSLDFARDICKRSEVALAATGVELLPYPDLVIEVADAKAAAKKFREEEVDLIVIQNGTFAAADLTVELATATTVPLVLWAIPEPDVHGQRLLANSFCGANLNSSSLVKLNKKFKYFYAWPEDATFREEIAADVRPLRRLWHCVTPWKVDLAWWLAELVGDAPLAANPREVDSIHWLTPAEMLAMPDLLESNREFLTRQPWRA